MDEADDLIPPPRPLALSQRLARIVAEEGQDRLSFTDLATKLQSRAWGGLLLIFAAINLLPLPPGTSAFFALPILIVSAQMVFGRSTPWFPARLNRRGVTKQELRRLIGKIEWLETRIERVLKPRLAGLTGPAATRIIGLVCFILALVAAIPVPLFHVAPAAAIVLFGLALIYRDGALVIAAAVASVLSLVFDALIIGSGVVALSYAASWLRR
ncbi:MAG TPA: exopolysaccharide biosynthesis protein [Sphingomicrobium sp.]|nr:exopolysaccharide biosynthesis protein [Sphingomicrobium sp.]